MYEAMNLQLPADQVVFTAINLELGATQLPVFPFPSDDSEK